MREAIIVGFAVLLCSAAHSQPVPRYDVDRACSEWAGEMHASPNPPCVLFQQQAYETVLVLWPQAASTTRARCIDFASKMHGQYRSLLPCLEADVQARALSTPQHFQP